MTSSKLRMLIAEDSPIADQLARLFSGDFTVTVARTGQDAFAEVKNSLPFDICIIDVIMPVEHAGLTLRDADTTGVRLIEHIVGNHKCGRILVLSVRSDLETTISQITGKHSHLRLLAKQNASSDSIRAAVSELMRLQIPNNRADAAAFLNTANDTYKTILQALSEGETAKEELSAALRNLVFLLRSSVDGPSLRSHQGSDVIARMFATLTFWGRTFDDKDVEKALSDAKDALGETIVNHGLYK